MQVDHRGADEQTPATMWRCPRLASGPSCSAVASRPARRSGRVEVVAGRGRRRVAWRGSMAEVRVPECSSSGSRRVRPRRTGAHLAVRAAPASPGRGPARRRAAALACARLVLIRATQLVRGQSRRRTGRAPRRDRLLAPERHRGAGRSRDGRRPEAECPSDCAAAVRRRAQLERARAPRPPCGARLDHAVTRRIDAGRAPGLTVPRTWVDRLQLTDCKARRAGRRETAKLLRSVFSSRRGLLDDLVLLPRHASRRSCRCRAREERPREPGASKPSPTELARRHQITPADQRGRQEAPDRLAAGRARRRGRRPRGSSTARRRAATGRSSTRGMQVAEGAAGERGLGALVVLGAGDSALGEGVGEHGLDHGPVRSDARMPALAGCAGRGRTGSTSRCRTTCGQHRRAPTPAEVGGVPMRQPGLASPA